MIKEWMKNNRLHDPDDIDALLETADLIRQLIHDRNYADIKTMINYAIDHNLYECFDWIMALLQEEYEKTQGYDLDDFVCDIGGAIADYNEFTSRLQLDFEVHKNDIEKAYDENGEVDSFFNNLTYKTKYENIYLVSSENFDTKDNDYILYRLKFIRSSAG